MTGPRIGELFAGYGGLGMGVQAALGGEIAWYSEIDKGALKILEHRFPGVPNVGDITTVDWSQVEPVDILTGGSPCQDLSHAGKRAGMTEGTRSNLWVAMREAIAQLRPGLVIWENVRGAYSAAADSAVEPCPGCVGDGPGVHLRALGRVLGDLSELGYVGGWHGLRAADVGAPHGRFRVFVVAYPASDAGRIEYGDGAPLALASDVRHERARAAWDGRTRPEDSGLGDVTLLPTPTSQAARHDADDRGPGTLDDHNLWSVAARIGNAALLPTPRAGDGEKGGPNQRGSSGDFMLPSAVTHLLPTPAVNDMGAAYTPDEWDAWCEAQKAKHGNGNGHGHGHGKSLHIETARLVPTPTGRDWRDGGDTGADVEDKAYLGRVVWNREAWGQYAEAIHRWETLTRGAPSPTELNKLGNRRLAPPFSEWLMGLPAGWVTDVPGITRNEALRALGNGVVPQQAEAAVRFLLSVAVAA